MAQATTLGQVPKFVMATQVSLGTTGQEGYLRRLLVGEAGDLMLVVPGSGVPVEGAGGTGLGIKGDQAVRTVECEGEGVGCGALLGEQASCRCVPHGDVVLIGLVGRVEGGSDSPPVAGEGECPEPLRRLGQCFGVASGDRSPQLVVGHIPDTDLVVRALHREAAPVRTQLHATAAQRPARALERRQRLACSDVVQMDVILCLISIRVEI